MRKPVLLEPATVLVELPPRDHGFEERAAADHRSVERAVEGDLLLEVPGHVRRAPPELDDVDVVPGGVEEPLDFAQVEALVDHVREALRARLRGPGGQVEETVKAGHTDPP